MIRHIRVHGTNHSDIIDVFRDFGEKFTDFNAAPAVFRKPKRRLKCSTRSTLGLQIIHRQGLSVQPGKFRLRIEGIDVRWSAVGKNVNDTLCFRWKMGCSRSKRRIAAYALCCRRPQLRSKEIGEAQHSEAEAAATQEIAAGEKGILEPRLMMRRTHWSHRKNEGLVTPSLSCRGGDGEELLLCLGRCIVERGRIVKFNLLRHTNIIRCSRLNRPSRGKINQHFQLSSGFFLLVYPLRVFQSTMKQDPVVVSTQSLETFLAYHVLLFSQILVRFELPSGGARFLQISN